MNSRPRRRNTGAADNTRPGKGAERLSGWLLLAQLAVNLVLVLMAIVVIVAGSALFLSVHAPSQVPGSILSVLLAGAGLVAIQ